MIKKVPPPTAVCVVGGGLYFMFTPKTSERIGHKLKQIVVESTITTNGGQLTKETQTDAIGVIVPQNTAKRAERTPQVIHIHLIARHMLHLLLQSQNLGRYPSQSFASHIGAVGQNERPKKLHPTTSGNNVCLTLVEHKPQMIKIITPESHKRKSKSKQSCQRPSECEETRCRAALVSLSATSCNRSLRLMCIK